MSTLSRRHLLAAGLGLAGAGRAGAAVPAAATSLPPLPPVVDLRALLTPARDQGAVRDTCAHFAFVAAAEAVLARDTGRILPLSEEFLARMARPPRHPPFNETTNMLVVAGVATAHGLLPLDSMPYQPATSSGCRRDAPACRPAPAPSPRQLAEAARLKLGDMRMVRGRNKVRRMLTTEHSPVIVPLKLPDDHAGWRDDGLVVAQPRVLALPWWKFLNVPNHFVVLSGYDDGQQMFFFKNSWGTGWGDNGHGRISYADLDRYVAGDGYGYYIRNLVQA